MPQVHLTDITNVFALIYPFPLPLGPAGDAVWEVSLDPVTEPGPFELSAALQDCTVTLDDVLFGDVWVCAGQENMAFRLSTVRVCDGVRVCEGV